MKTGIDTQKRMKDQFLLPLLMVFFSLVRNINLHHISTDCLVLRLRSVPELAEHMPLDSH